MDCVSEAEALGFLHDTLEPAQRTAIERHLDSCAECLELVTLAGKTSLAVRDHGVTDEAASLAGSALLGRYEIGEPLGRGAMGMVYVARDTQLGRRVAIKVVHPSLAGDAASQLRLHGHRRRRGVPGR